MYKGKTDGDLWPLDLCFLLSLVRATCRKADTSQG